MTDPATTPGSRRSTTARALRREAAAVGTAARDGRLLTRGTVEPALGHHHRVLGLTSCTDPPVVLDGAPALDVRDGTGDRLHPTVTADPPSPPGWRTLPAGASASLRLHWLADARPGRPDAGHELPVTAPTEPPVMLTLRDQLDLDTTSTIQVHDWAPTVARAVQQ